MAIDAAEMLFGEYPGRCHPTLHHVRVAPSRHVVRAALDPALWALDDVGGGQTFVPRFRDLEPLQGEHLLHPLAQAPRRRLMIPLQKSRQLFQPFLALLRGLYSPGGSHQVQGLTMLLLGQLVEDIAYFVVAATLHWLVAAKHLFDGATQRLGSVDHEQVFAVSG